MVSRKKWVKVTRAAAAVRATRFEMVRGDVREAVEGRPEMREGVIRKD